MSEKVGMLSFPTDSQSFQKPYSQDTAKMIDEEVRALVDGAYKRTAGERAGLHLSGGLALFTFSVHRHFLSTFSAELHLHIST